MFENENIIRNSTVDCILSRRSVRAYKDEPLTAAQLEPVLYAGLWAPSGRNSPPEKTGSTLSTPISGVRSGRTRSPTAAAT